ncbi:hypothetical protein MRX96_045535 [Rhipicephalus microplus]
MTDEPAYQLNNFLGTTATAEPPNKMVTTTYDTPSQPLLRPPAYATTDTQALNQPTYCPARVLLVTRPSRESHEHRFPSRTVSTVYNAPSQPPRIAISCNLLRRHASSQSVHCPVRALLVTGPSRESHDHWFKVRSYRGVCASFARNPS